MGGQVKSVDHFALSLLELPQLNLQFLYFLVFEKTSLQKSHFTVLLSKVILVDLLGLILKELEFLLLHLLVDIQALLFERRELQLVQLLNLLNKPMESEGQLLVEELGRLNISAVYVYIVQDVTISQKLVKDDISSVLLVLNMLGNIDRDNCLCHL